MHIFKRGEIIKSGSYCTGLHSRLRRACSEAVNHIANCLGRNHRRNLSRIVPQQFVKTMPFANHSVSKSQIWFNCTLITNIYRILRLEQLLSGILLCCFKSLPWCSKTRTSFSKLSVQLQRRVFNVQKRTVCNILVQCTFQLEDLCLAPRRLARNVVERRRFGYAVISDLVRLEMEPARSNNLIQICHIDKYLNTYFAATLKNRCRRKYKTLSGIGWSPLALWPLWRVLFLFYE